MNSLPRRRRHCRLYFTDCKDNLSISSSWLRKSEKVSTTSIAVTIFGDRYYRSHNFHLPKNWESWYSYQSVIWKIAEQILSSRIWLKAFCKWFSVYILKMLSLPMEWQSALRVYLWRTRVYFFIFKSDGSAEIHICSILCWYVVFAGLQGFCAFFCHVLAVGLHHVGPQKPIPDTSKNTFTIHRYSIHRTRIHMF